MTLVLPGATLGMLGGGQLGRMTAMAARPLGYRTVILDPDPHCAATAVADGHLVAPFDDPLAAGELARGAALVTYEIERISPRSLQAAAYHAPLRPSAAILGMVQDRTDQKRWLESRGFPVGAWAPATTAGALESALAALGGPCRVKAVRGGYDGRAQTRAASPAEARAAWDAIGHQPVVVEREVSLEAEGSVLVARSPSGAVAVHPPARNWHLDGVLDVSVLPGDLPPRAAAEMTALARAIAETLGLEGVLVVEFFLAADGRVLVNELAPRPHNSYHHADTACVTGQFEQLVRAVCDLPLGDTRVVRPSALANLLGDLWAPGTPPFDAALALPGVRLHLYGKVPRPKRKVGHLTASADTPAGALAAVREAFDRLRRGGGADLRPRTAVT